MARQAVSRRDRSGLPGDTFSWSIAAPRARVDRSFQVAPQGWMVSTDRDNGAPDAGGDRLASPLDRITDTAHPTAEPEITGDRLGELLSLLPRQTSPFPVPGCLGFGLLVVELAQSLTDLPS